MSHKVMIVGTGHVGASIAFAILNQQTAVNELILTDIIARDAEGEAMDLSDAIAVAPSYVKIRNGTYKDAKDCDVVIITAGAAQHGKETRRELLKKNANIIKGMVDQIMDSGFNGIFIVVTNPVDVMAYLVWKFSGLPCEKVIGTGTVLDTARLCERISSYVGINPKSIHAFQVGEHGDSEFALWSSANIGGQPVATMMPKSTLNGIEGFVRGKAYEIIDRKGSTEYGIGVSTVRILSCILGDERRVLSVSSYHDYDDIYYGFPAVIGREGVIRQIDVELSEEEGIKMAKSVNALKEMVDSLKLDKKLDRAKRK
ncbi:L-lactate dehydrogenase [Candidatus Saccharibacteria bacterium]|nr:L-lactate dehydrogenase [Candidatus Saccharibacteria bacterium]